MSIDMSIDDIPSPLINGRTLVPCEPHEVTIALWDDPIPKIYIVNHREETDDEFRKRILGGNK